MIKHGWISTLLRNTLVWWSLTFIAVVVAGFSLAGPAQAAGVVGNGTSASCTEAALDAALAGGGTVTFNCGGVKTFTFTTEKVITQDTVIQGTPGFNFGLHFSGNAATRLFRVMAPAKLTLNDLTLEKGYNPNDGGAILNLGTLALNNVQVENNTSRTCGGAIWTQGAVIIANSRFENNSAVTGGGAICTSAGGAPALQITNSRFRTNGAAQAGSNVGYGGALALNATATLIATNTEFFGNKAQFGGALAILPGAAATVRGGLNIIAFDSNSATHSGAAIYNLGTFSAYNTQILRNEIPRSITVNGFGGGIASLGTLTLHNSFVINNLGRFGGGLYLGGDPNSSRTDLQQVRITGNEATVTGGGIFVNTNPLTVTNTAFGFNRAEGSGGGLACSQCARLRVSNSVFITNTAAYGGGLYVSAAAVGGYVHVESVTFSGNQSTTSRGGGVYNQGNLELYFSTLAYNGNGIHSFSGANTRLRSSVLHNPGYTNCGSEGNVQYSNDGANHVSDDSCGPAFAAKGDPKLGPLQLETQQQYWFTQFHLPLAGSPLINLGHSACPARDQRGALRPDACDIGAVEFGGLVSAPSSGNIYLPLVLK